MSPDKTKQDPEYGFKVLKDANDQTSLQFSHAGQTKNKTLVHLMAMLLKAHLQIIAKETGEKPDRLGFHIFDSFEEDARGRIKAQLQEACQLMNIECEDVCFD